MAAIVFLADHPEAVPALAASFEREWPEHYGPGKFDARQDLQARLNKERLPIGLLALEGGVPIGTLYISSHAQPSHGDLVPLLGGFWVAPAFRNRGLGTELVRTAVDVVRGLGFPRLHVSTQEAASLFVREGWIELPSIVHDGDRLRVFARDL